MIKYLVNSEDHKIIDTAGDDELCGSKGKTFFMGVQVQI